MITIESKHIERVEKVAQYTSVKLKVDFGDMHNYLLDKLPRIQKNFKPAIGSNFDDYLTISLRFYSLNFIRDNSFSVKVSSKDLNIYNKATRWKCLRKASRRLGLSEETLREICDRVTNNRRTHALSLESSSNIQLTEEVKFNSYSDFVHYVGGEIEVKKLKPAALKNAWVNYDIV